MSRADTAQNATTAPGCAPLNPIDPAAIEEARSRLVNTR